MRAATIALCLSISLPACRPTAPAQPGQARVEQTTPEPESDSSSNSSLGERAVNRMNGLAGRLRLQEDRFTGSAAGTKDALQDGLDWLEAHQSADGSWDADGFMARCRECDMPGWAAHDVGVTGLALLAFLGDGNTTRHGDYKETVTRGTKWLKEQQDYDTGLIGEKTGSLYMYGHAIATLALTEAYYFSKSPLLRGPTQKAINFIVVSRNPYKAWRYDSPPVGDNDTSVTSWMVFALFTAEQAGLRIDEMAFAGALAWFDEVTDTETGRTGYDSCGSRSSRFAEINEQFPVDRTEAMTAAALCCRFFLDETPDERGSSMKKSADLLRAKLPGWDAAGLGCDMYYWYYGSYAMYQMGGEHWRAWNDAMKPVVIEHQRRDGDFRGSWDPIGPWGSVGGRVYSTAMMCLCLEVYYRYPPRYRPELPR